MDYSSENGAHVALVKRVVKAHDGLGFDFLTVRCEAQRDQAGVHPGRHERAKEGPHAHSHGGSRRGVVVQ